MPCSLAKASAPPPTIITWRDLSITARASVIGFLTRCTPATAPALPVAPSMIEESSSLSAIVGEYRATACVELRRVLQHGDGGGHRIQRRLAGAQLGMARAQRRFQRRARGGFLGRGHAGALDASAAMDHQQRGVHCHQDPVAHGVMAFGGRLLDAAAGQVQH